MQGRPKYFKNGIVYYKGWTIQWTGRSAGGIDSWKGTNETISDTLGGTDWEYVCKSIDWRNENEKNI